MTDSRRTSHEYPRLNLNLNEKDRITWDSEDEGDGLKICHRSATWFTMSRVMHAKDLYRMKSHSQDTRLGTQSTTHYEIVSVDVDDILPITKNPNEVMIKLWEKTTSGGKKDRTNLRRTMRQVGAWEGGERTQTIKSTQEDTRLAAATRLPYPER